jgi:Protein of unknown function (DUF962)
VGKSTGGRSCNLVWRKLEAVEIHDGSFLVSHSIMGKIVNHNYTQRSEPAGGFKTLEEFYPFYLGEHCNQINRRLHITGTKFV